MIYASRLRVLGGQKKSPSHLSCLEVTEPSLSGQAGPPESEEAEQTSPAFYPSPSLSLGSVFTDEFFWCSGEWTERDGVRRDREPSGKRHVGPKAELEAQG